MRKLDRLINEAKQAMRDRGHRPDRAWRDGGTAVVHCVRCPLSADVDVAPAPNGIELGGAAVATRCDPPVPTRAERLAAATYDPTGPVPFPAAG